MSIQSLQKRVLCPDCLENYMLESQAKQYGICRSCKQSYERDKTLGIPHVKYKDEDVKSREKRNKIRFVQKMYSTRKTNEKKGITKEYIDAVMTLDYVEYVKKIASPKLCLVELYVLFMHTYADFGVSIPDDFAYLVFRETIIMLNLPYLATLPMSVTTEIRELSKIKKEDYLKIIDSILSDNSSEKEDSITIQESNNSADNKAIISKSTTISNQIEQDNGDVMNQIASSIDNTIMEITKSTTSAKTEVEKPMESDRFKQAETEIKNTIKPIYKELNCDISDEYTIHTYLDLLNQLIYLSKDVDKILKDRDTQYNVMNAYQGDVIHEIENEVPTTYLADKLHVIRNIRRKYSNDVTNLNILKPFLDSLDVSLMQTTLNRLKSQLQAQTSPEFMPIVDASLTTKYSWAKPLNEMATTPARLAKFKSICTKSSPAKSIIPYGTRGPMLVKCNLIGENYPTDYTWTHVYSNETIQTAICHAKNTLRQLIQSENNVRYTNLMAVPLSQQLTYSKVYRVSCNISGKGFGVFKKWYKDYVTTDKQTAMDLAQQDLDGIKAIRKGVLINNMDCTEMGV